MGGANATRQPDSAGYFCGRGQHPVFIAWLYQDNAEDGACGFGIGEKALEADKAVKSSMPTYKADQHRRAKMKHSKAIDIDFVGQDFDAFLADECQRRLNIDPPCRSNFDPGRVAGF